MGVPDAMSDALVNQGAAQFTASASARFLTVGGSGGNGEALGSADLTAFGGASIGVASGTGTGRVSTGTGALTIAGADLTVLPFVDEFGLSTPGTLRVGRGGGTGRNNSFTGVGSLEVVDGDINVNGFVQVGGASGTGTDTQFRGTGALKLTNGTLVIQGGLSVGTSSGTSSATGISNGELLVEHGDILISPSDILLQSSLTIGVFGGTGSYRGHGAGAVTLIDGRIITDSVQVGVASGIVEAQGSSNGRLTLRDGELTMKSMLVGAAFDESGPAVGIVELMRSRVMGDTATFGSDGALVLGIGGSQPGDFGQVVVTATAAFAGDVEARFIEGFQPTPGDVFDLIAAGNIVDDYVLSITGINPLDFPNMRVTRSDTLLRIAFVPEPCSIMLLGMAVAAAGLKKNACCAQ
jgi:hypothetical protein